MSLEKDVNDAIRLFIAHLTKIEKKHANYLIITVGPCKFRFSLKETIKNQDQFTSKIVGVLEANKITEGTEIKLRTEAHRTLQENVFFRKGRALAEEQELTPEYVYEATVGKGRKKRSSSIDRDDEHHLSSISPAPGDETKPSPF